MHCARAVWHIRGACCFFPCCQLFQVTRLCVLDFRHGAHNGSRKSHVFISSHKKTFFFEPSRAAPLGGLFYFFHFILIFLTFSNCSFCRFIVCDHGPSCYFLIFSFFDFFIFLEFFHFFSLFLLFLTCVSFFQFWEGSGGAPCSSFHSDAASTNRCKDVVLEFGLTGQEAGYFCWVLDVLKKTACGALHSSGLRSSAVNVLAGILFRQHWKELVLDVFRRSWQSRSCTGVISFVLVRCHQRYQIVMLQRPQQQMRKEGNEQNKQMNKRTK